jgi:hypothetical protein
MARGRDATDVALSTSFGPNRLVKFTVITDEVQEIPPHLTRTTAQSAAGATAEKV